MRTKRLLFKTFLSIVILSGLIGCSDDDDSVATTSTTKTISAFSFTADKNTALSSDVTATINGTNISVTVPYGTDVTALVATFTTTGESVKIGSTTQVSGTTANDFSSAVTYRVTATDSSTQDYTDSSTQDYTVTVSNSVSYTAGSVSFTMISVPGGITFPIGTDDLGAPATVANVYLISQTEVTYELWSAVHTWALSNGYFFANAGTEGHDGTPGAAPTAAQQEPVTTINWRDAMVWMNALTEYTNAQNGTSRGAVYSYSDATIRDSRDTNATACDDAVASSTADGFRLLSLNEWELAARYITDDGDNTLDKTGEYYPGLYVSGADAQYDATTGGSDIDGDSDIQYSTDVAVYSGSATAVVKSKSSNALGLFDMGGNAMEWAFDLNGANRVGRGGGWNFDEYDSRVGRLGNYAPELARNDIGFRIAGAP